MLYRALFLTIPFLVVFVASLDFDRISLAGNDWIINDNGSYSAQGQVPGTIHTILLAQNKIPDPYWSRNNVNLRHLIYTPWTFRKNFSLPQDFLSNTQFTLHFDQVDTVANITLNGCFLGQTNNMFLAYIFNVSKSCLQSNNQLRLDFESPVLYALHQMRAYNESVPPDCPPEAQNGECYVQFIRKEPCSFSWGWGPAFAPIGIIGNLYLEGKNMNDIVILLDSVNVASYETSTDNWRVDILLSSENAPFTSELKFVLENTSFIFQSNISFDHNVSISLLIPNKTVRLWWPNGYGDQPLYTLSVYKQEQIIGSRLLGFRTVELAQHVYGHHINGTSFYFLINGIPVFVKGSNWVPPDSFQERVTDEQLERLLRSTKLANMNMLRVWGGGIYERDSFYEMADRLGIMLWHDFMFACSLYPVDESFLTNVRNEVIYQVKRLQSHASIVLWSGNNENEALIAQNWYQIPPEKIPKAKDDYRKLYVSTVMVALQEVDKGNNRPFVTSSPSNGIETIAENYVAANPVDPLYGDVHFYHVHNDSCDPNAYPITRFLSETGIQSLPSLDTWYQITNNTSDLQYDSDFVIFREQNYGLLAGLKIQIETKLPLPTTSDSLQRFSYMIYLSQITQALTLQSLSDWCRVHSTVEMIDPMTSRGNTMGLMYWQLNDMWQAPTYSTLEYDVKWKLSHYYVQHMYEPVYPLVILTPYLANLTDENAHISIYVINELLAGVHGRLSCSLISLDSFTQKSTFTYDISLVSPNLRLIADLSYTTVMRSAGCSNSNECLFHCRLNSTKEDIGQTLFLAQPKNYQLYQPNLRIQKIQQVSSTELSITITATRPALFVWLDLPTNMNGYFSRNGFHMFEPIRTVSFYSWTPMMHIDVANLDLQINSLFDVTQS